MPLLPSRQAACGAASGAAFGTGLCGVTSAQNVKRIEQFEPELDKIIGTGEPISQLADGVGGDNGPAEGPLWWKEGGYLLFSDMPGDHLRRWSEKDGVTTFRKPCNKSNGLAWDDEGRLIACEHASSCLTRTETDGSITVRASGAW